MRRIPQYVLLILVLALAGSGSLGRLVAPTATAQEAVAVPDFATWETLATRIEEAVSTARASSEVFEVLRTEVAVWRERFIAAQGINADRIVTLQGQIEALGPVPAAGETEPPEIADRRKSLNDQLLQLRAPGRAAVEALRRAEGLIREIDRIVREQQASVILQFGPTPLNPTLWPTAITKFYDSLRGVVAEVTRAWGSDAERKKFTDGLPVTILYLVIAALLLARGRVVMERTTGLVLDRFKGKGRGLVGFLTSLAQIIVPVLGIVLLVQALASTGLIGLRGKALTEGLPFFGLCVFGARWLSLRLFPKQLDVTRPLPASPEQARAMRWYATALGLLIGLAGIMTPLVEYEGYDDGARAVLFYPFILVGGVVMFRIGQILLTLSRIGSSGDAANPFGTRVLALVGRAASLLGLLGPVLGGVGYINAGLFLVLPGAYSLALLGMLLVLHFLIGEVYAVITRSEPQEAREALIPSLVTFAMMLVAMPFFALIWGARVSDLTELWARFQAGFSVGSTQISPASFLTFVVAFGALFIATRLIQGALKTSVLPKTHIDSGGQTAIISGVGYVGIFLAAVIAITAAGIDLSSLAIVAGALSLGIGFGLQNIVSNFVSGIILLVERPISEGDWIEVGGTMGIVRKISVRSTRIETFDRTDVIVPNADFVSGVVTNWTRGNKVGRLVFAVGVAYGSDTRRVSELLLEIANAHALVAVEPPPAVDFVEFGADSLNFRVRAILKDVNLINVVRTEMLHLIVERFAEEGIEIPFAQRDIWLRNPEALHAPGADPTPPTTTLPTAPGRPTDADMGVTAEDEGDST